MGGRWRVKKEKKKANKSEQAHFTSATLPLHPSHLPAYTIHICLPSFSLCRVSVCSEVAKTQFRYGSNNNNKSERKVYLQYHITLQQPAGSDGDVFLCRIYSSIRGIFHGALFSHSFFNSSTKVRSVSSSSSLCDIAQ